MSEKGDNGVESGHTKDKAIPPVHPSTMFFLQMAAVANTESGNETVGIASEHFQSKSKNIFRTVCLVLVWVCMVRKSFEYV